MNSRNHVDALTRCRFPHQVVMAIQDALTSRHLMRDTAAREAPGSGRDFGSIDRDICDQIEEVIENARKTTKVLAQPTRDVLDPFDNGSGER